VFMCLCVCFFVSSILFLLLQYAVVLLYHINMIDYRRCKILHLQSVVCGLLACWNESECDVSQKFQVLSFFKRIPTKHIPGTQVELPVAEGLLCMYQ